MQVCMMRLCEPTAQRRRCCTARSSALVEGNDSRNFASATASAHDAFQSLTGSAISAVTRRRQSGGGCGNQ